MGKSPFPPMALSEVLMLAETIWKHNAGKPMKRLTLFDALDRQPDSGTSRQLVTASAGYGLTEGSYKADVIKLTERGRSIVATRSVQALLDAALQHDVFRKFFENYRDNLVPGRAPAIDFLKDQGLTLENAGTCLDIILKNGRHVGLIRMTSGKERIVSADFVLDQHGETTNNTRASEDSTTSDIQSDPRNGSQNGIEGKEVVDRAALADIHSRNGQNEQLLPLHLNVQIHIDANAKPEQIEHVFASMAKYLYGRG